MHVFGHELFKFLAHFTLSLHLLLILAEFQFHVGVAQIFQVIAIKLQQIFMFLQILHQIVLLLSQGINLRVFLHFLLLLAILQVGDDLLGLVDEHFIAQICLLQFLIPRQQLLDLRVHLLQDLLVLQQHEVFGVVVLGSLLLGVVWLRGSQT